MIDYLNNEYNTFIINQNNFMSSEDIKNPLLPKQEQKKDKIKPVPFFSLFKFADNLDRLLMIIGTLGAMAAGASTPFFMIFFSEISLIFVDGNQQNAQKQGLQTAIKFFIIGGATWFLNFLGLYCWGMTGKRQTLRFKKMYYKTLLEQQVAWYDSNDVNKLATQISANMIAVQNAIGQKISFLLTILITSVFGFFYAYFKCWQLSLVLTGFLPLILMAGVLLMKSLQYKAQISKVSYEGASSIAEQAFSSIRTVKSFVAQSFEEEKFKKQLSLSQNKVTKYILFSSAGLGIMTLVFLGLYSFGFWYGKQLIIWNQDYSAPTIISTFFCFLIGGASVGQISPFLKSIAQGKVAAGRLYYLMERKRTLIEPQQGVSIQQINSIKLQNISFQYEKVDQQNLEQQKSKLKTQNIVESSQLITNEQKSLYSGISPSKILQNITIQFEKGKVTAIVGESGSGKSTIIQLLMRYYDPKQGKITINNTDMPDIDIKKFRRNIGYVGQQPVLFSMTIAENIRLSNPNITDEQIKQVLRKSNAWQFVEKCQKGIQTYVGSGGTQFSGGQKQRIAIARALAKNPTMLVLDEATSALDRKNQKQIQQTLHNLSKGNITTIVIAHRLSTIKNANKIIVLGKGRLLEQGTHEQLYSKQGAYHQLVKSQMSADIQNQVVSQMKEQQQFIKPIERKKSVLLTKQTEKQKQKQKQQQKQRFSKQQLDSVFGKLFKQAKGYYGYLFTGSICAVFNGLIWPFFNIAFSNIMSLMAQARKKSDDINWYCLMFLIVAVAGSLTTFLYTVCFDIVGNRTVLQLRKKLFYKLIRLPVSYYDKADNTPGAISTKLSQDSFQINNMITGILAVVCLNISTVSASLFFAFYYSWKLTLIVLATSPLMIISGSINMKVMKGMHQKSQKFQKAIGSMISDTVCNIRTVKSFGNQKVFQQLFDDKLEQINKIVSQKALKTSILQGMARGSVLIIQGLTFWIASILFANGQITEPKAIYIAIFSIIFAAMGVGQNSQFMPDMNKSKIAGASVYQILESKDQVQISKQDEDPQVAQIQGDIQFKNVQFKYPERQAIVLKNFSIKIHSGQKIAFVGPSGSGKSTIIQILMRFYDIQSGQILINGHNIKKFNLEKYRRQIGLVSQQPSLFLGTVKQNIIYNSQGLDNEQQKIQKYCKIVHASQFINEWPQKFEKQVGQKGSQVSGGQKQRIALARCLIRQPKLIMLDQSTSALDADTQKIVFQNLKQVLKNKTSISIAHRLSTIQDSNRIVVMRDGQIIEQGGYEQLMSKKDNFYRLAKGTN